MDTTLLRCRRRRSSNISSTVPYSDHHRHVGYVGALETSSKRATSTRTYWKHIRSAHISQTVHAVSSQLCCTIAQTSLSVLWHWGSENKNRARFFFTRIILAESTLESPYTRLAVDVSEDTDEDANQLAFYLETVESIYRKSLASD